MYTATLHQTPLPRYEIHGHQTANYSYITDMAHKHCNHG